MKADLLREKFLGFFKARKHKIVESDSLVPKDDPTVLFTPAGMNQFKKEFLGIVSDYRRAASAQRCLRTDDLDKVGRTCGHHTFFEMLGNFSFGDYFKKEAIAWAWEFLTEELDIDREKLWVSVYKDDAEAFEVWRDLVKVPHEKVIKLGDKENFWPAEAKEKGPNGPCGPCSEIFFDQGSNVGCKKPDCNPACNCGRFVEVWNLVFTQFNRKEGGRLEPLPKKNIDTGMGLERLAAVMQGVKSNFETELFQPIIKEIVQGLSPKGTVPERELIYAIADHIRAIVFAIFDGVLPSNEARGYVVRKLIRKAALNLKAMGIDKPFLYKLVPILSEIMHNPYPELENRRENIAEIILAEEKNFYSVLDSSGILLSEKFSQFSREKQNPEKVGVIAFQLYDTFGLPLELTLDWLNKQGVKFSQSAFEKELEKQKNRSKSQSAMKGNVFDIKGLDLGVKESKFLGYKDYETKAKLLKIFKNGAEIKKISKGDTAEVILDKTVFYPESGGQVADTGELVRGKNIFEVLDTRKAGKAIVHIGKVKAGNFKKGDLVSTKIDLERRLAIARNHTATHLLQAALRKVLGVHVRQQGSLVAPERLRFDFTHFKDISPEEMERIEELMNNYILNNYPLSKKEMSLAQAKKSGALAFFAEKYEEKVRVVSIGNFSKELCAGTHLESTGQIGLFKIIEERSVASGIRRIEAVTGAFAHQAVKEEKQKILQEIERGRQREKELEKELKSHKINQLCASISNLLQRAEKINNINLITAIENDIDMESLRRAMDMVKQQTNNAVIALASQDLFNAKALLVIGVTPDLLPRGLDATALIRAVAKNIGGSGGGRKDFAQAGGNKPENFPNAFGKLKEIIQNLP